MKPRRDLPSCHFFQIRRAGDGGCRLRHRARRPGRVRHAGAFRMGLRCSEWARPGGATTAAAVAVVVLLTVVDGAAFAVEAVGGSGARSQEVTEMESGTA